MASTIRPTATEADLLRTPKDGRKYELVDGAIRVSPAGTRHGMVCVNFLLRIGSVRDALPHQDRAEAERLKRRFGRPE